MKGWVKRFARPVIFIHWFYAAAFLTLVTTGIGFEYKWAAFLMGPAARTIHRGAATVFVMAPIIYLITAKSGWKHVAEAFIWSMDDVRWLLKAPLHYMVGKGDMPPAGFFNAGQKLNYLIVMFTNIAFTLSGLFMWFQRPNLALPQRDWFRTAAAVHEASFFVGAAMFAMHFYLSLIHPFTKQAITAMMSGYVTRSYAAIHHPKWLEELDHGGN
jgi:formate dehydrogenase subunit gamma